MKKLIAFIFILFSLLASAQTVSISGKITNYSGNDSLKLLVYLSNTPEQHSIAVSPKGEFSYSLPSTQTSYAKIFFNPEDYLLLIVTPKEKITITANYLSMARDNKIEGSEQTTLWNANNAELMKFDYVNQQRKAAFERTTDSLENLKREYVISFIKKNPTSLASLAVIDLLDISVYPKVYEFLDSTLMKAHKGNPLVENFHASVQQLMFLKEGSIAPDIILLDQNGKQVSLSSLRGKIVLIDFWASWCRPCRMEIPNLKNAYALYHKKGFEIYSVSIDKDRAAWIQALGVENMPWPTVHDAENKYSTMYNVTSIPNTLLINKDGTIIAKNLRGSGVEEQLRILLGK